MYIILLEYESVWPEVCPQNKCRSLWPIFHGPVIVPYSLKTVSCMNIIIWDYESVWHDSWPQNKCRSLWTTFYGPVIFCYILKTYWCLNISLGDYGSVWPEVWPQNKRMSLWLIFHGPLILPYISKSIYYLIDECHIHTCDLSRSGVNLPIWRLPLCPPDEAAKIPIFMNSDF